MKHTPGPWVATHANGNDFIVKSGDIEVVAGCGCYGSPYMRGSNPDADARLIAAAPDLLAALQALVYGELKLPMVSERKQREQLQEMALAAIAKATGESQ